MLEHLKRWGPALVCIGLLILIGMLANRKGIAGFLLFQLGWWWRVGVERSNRRRGAAAGDGASNVAGHIRMIKSRLNYRLLLTIVLLLLAGGGAHAQSGPHTPEEKAFCRANPEKCAILEGNYDWVACLRRNLAVMDDGVSDAATVADGVLPLCRSYYTGPVGSHHQVYPGASTRSDGGYRTR